MSRPRTAWLDPADPEYGEAWRRLEDKYGDPVAECPDTGEVWQYMGTAERVGPGPTDWCHEFRHRHHPKAGRRLYTAVRASAGWTPEEVGA